MRSRGGNGFERGRFNDVAKAGCEADGTRHSQAVFAETDGRVANRADNSLFQVLSSADEVQYLLCLRVQHHAVNGEIAAKNVLLGRAGVLDTIRMAPVGIAEI